MGLTVVMGHAAFSPERREMLPEVLESWDDKVELIVEDDIKQGAWPTIRQCWQEAMTRTSDGHLLAAQDDFVLAQGGVDFLEQLCDRFPDRVLSFRWPLESLSWFHQKVCAEGATWGRTSYAWTGGAVAVPRSLCQDFLDWAAEFDQLGGHRYEHMDDARLDMWCLARGHDVWRTRWSVLHHIGDVSVVRKGPRMKSEEMGLVDRISDVPSLSDPRWDDPEPPTERDWPHGFKLNASTVLRGRQRQVGLL